MENEFNLLKQQISLAFEECNNSPCLVHSDLFKIGIPVRKKIDKDFLCSFYEETLVEACKSGLIIPTFNYEFGNSSKYNVRDSKSQIGILSDHFRQKYPNKRSIDPIFNAVSINYTYKGGVDCNLFGINSLFGTLVQDNAWICFLGAGFESNTFIHYVEELNNIGYRYIKKISGTVTDCSKDTQPLTIDYRVRPRVSESCNYKWFFLEDELRKEGLLFSKKICKGKLLYFNAKKVLNFWSEKLKSNEFYLLTVESKNISLELYEKYGRPLPNIEGIYHEK